MTHRWFGTPWSLIQETELAHRARLIIYDNKGLDYHNWDHVVSMYQYLADTNEPYDEALDWAILFHDIVYDNEPEKELRSGKAFVEMVASYEGCNLRPAEQAQVYSLIMRTVNHTVMPEVKGSSAIVRADLHGLTKQLTAFQNFGKIMSESMKLYNIDMVTFAENTEKFMGALVWRVANNTTADPDHQDFYLQVCDGILYTISLAQFVQGKTK